jgi:hypothetical protein
LATAPKSEIVAGFNSLNYDVVQTYYDHNLWKTNAPPEAVYDIFKHLKQKHCEGDEYLRNCPESSIAHKILSAPMSSDKVPNFDFDPE